MYILCLCYLNNVHINTTAKSAFVSQRTIWLCYYCAKQKSKPADILATVMLLYFSLASHNLKCSCQKHAVALRTCYVCYSVLLEKFHVDWRQAIEYLSSLPIRHPQKPLCVSKPLAHCNFAGSLCTHFASPNLRSVCIPKNYCASQDHCVSPENIMYPPFPLWLHLL